ncbi:MAG: YybH family protein [Gammaproteobacteria bacterium]
MNTENASAPEVQVRELLETWAKAVRARDTEAVLAHHSPEIVMFDVPPPEQWRGMQKYRESWQLFFNYFPREGGLFEIVEMDITASGDLAYGYGLLRCGRKDDWFPVRFTVCLRRIEGAWTIVHEHHSVPVGPAK